MRRDAQEEADGLPRALLGGRVPDLRGGQRHKLHRAIHGQTATEVIVERADATEAHMGLHTWTDAPHGKIQQFDIVVPGNGSDAALAQLCQHRLWHSGGDAHEVPRAVHDVHLPFELLPLKDVEPWGTPESGFSLSWYGLTYGWYDVLVGEQRLFSTPDGDPRGIDYQVAHLWEDLIFATPFVLEPRIVSLPPRLRPAKQGAREPLQQLTIHDCDDQYIRSS